MIDFLYAMLFGAIQGLTEFWPISSSGHLVIAHDVLKFDFIDSLSFDVALHLGTLVALFIYFWADIRRYIVAFARSIANFQVKTDADQRLAWLLALGTLPAAGVGFFLGDWIESSVRAVWIVASMLILGGVLFILFERYLKPSRDLAGLGWRGALVIGIAQAVALIPGVSRSGATILAGLGAGFSRSTAARFSFLLSIPIVFAAGINQMLKVFSEGVSVDTWLLMAAGFLVSAIVGYGAIRFLLKFLTQHSLNVFGYYRIVFGLVLVAYLLAK